MNQKLGRQTFALSRPPLIRSYACVGGRQESKGPLAQGFDELCADSFFGEKTWEKAESTMQKRALERALSKAGLESGQVDCIFAGDLLNQCIASAFSLRDSAIPFYGLYGACSTMGESLSLASLLLSGGFGSVMAAMTSSHFCTAERQYRMPVPYGSQRTPTAQWTATAAGCVILSDEEGSGVRITHLSCGRVVDMGIRDVSNMGAAMAGEDVKGTPYFNFFLWKSSVLEGKNWGIFDVDSMMHKYFCYIWYKNTKYGVSFTSGYRFLCFWHPVTALRRIMRS